jgi:hypothetical protein
MLKAKRTMEAMGDGAPTEIRESWELRLVTVINKSKDGVFRGDDVSCCSII